MTDSAIRSTAPSAAVRELDPVDPATAELLLPLLQAHTAHDMRRQLTPNVEQFRALLHPRPTSDSSLLAVFDAEGAPTACCTLNVDRDSNTTLAHGFVLSHPAYRGRGFASTLLEAAKDRARARGCERLVLDGPEAPGAVEFAAKRGGRLVSAEPRSVLDLKTVDRERFAVWAAPTGPDGPESPGGPGRVNSQYRSVRWTGACPDDLVASFAHAREVMNDAPHGDLELEHFSVDTDLVRAAEAVHRALGLRVRCVAAVAPDGSIAGFTSVTAYPPRHPQGSVGTTAVVAAHRGHGLGLRLKAEMTLWLLAEEPEMELLETWNNSDNEPMLAVNRLLGYEVSELWHAFEFAL